MTVNEVIEQVKPLINYDFNAAVRDTLFPIDKFVKSALESALNEINSKCRIIEKTIFIPMSRGVTSYSLNVSLYTKSKFSIVAPKNLILRRYDNVIYTFPNKFIENIINETSINPVFTSALQHLAENYNVMHNIVISDFVNDSGIYSSIVSKTDTSVDVADSTDMSGFCVNLDVADYNQYSYRKINSVVSNTLNLDSSIATFPAWSTGDVIYISETLPYLMQFTFQGMLKPGYFDTETVIPVQDQFLNDLPDLVVKYLYQVLAIRFPDQAKVYAGMLQTKLLLTSAEVISGIKERLNASIETAVSKPYQPYTEYYGR